MAAIGGGGFAYLSLRSPNLLPPESIQVRMTPENIARGEYLFTVLADCDGCIGRLWRGSSYKSQPVSINPLSNRACGFPAHGLTMIFLMWRA